ncbi:MAG: metallophosphoesterase [Clostridia bacterium]|nr:metallophosphoesterase [Clostridia bacterium]
MKQPDKYKIERDTLVIPGLKKRYRILQISDSHICFQSELDDEAIREKDRRTAEIWTSVGNGLSQLENFQNLVEFGHDIGCDCLIFSGDTVDRPSKGNIYEMFRLIKTVGNCFVIPGNHDTGSEFYRFFTEETNESPEIRVKELGELLLVGIDNGSREISDRIISELKTVLSGNRPVVFVHHIPIDSETLHPYAEKILKDSLPYYLLDTTRGSPNIGEYYSLLNEKETALKAVLAGHMHFSHSDFLMNGVPQYVTGAALSGRARVIDIYGT